MSECTLSLAPRDAILTNGRRQEIADIISDAAADTTDSPEIGPPPISQFVDLDPVKIDLAFRPRKLDNEELVGLSPALSVNLEQRKKRRDSLGGPESKKVSKVEPIQDNYESAGSLKAGAKRKFSVRDDEEREVDAKQADVSPDEFKFTRVASEERSRNKAAPSQPEKSGNKVTREVAIAKGAPEDKQSTAPISRKVLAPKSVNNSPRKSSRVMMSDDIKASKVDAAKANPAKERSRERREETVSIKAPAEPIIETAEVQVEPETPAGLDIISPSSSQPSTARAESRDTPPPSDLGSGTESQRPSRRARGSVSYAEPNLRDKMRRPTKELVDAVIIDAKPHRMSAVKLEGESASKAVKVKPEPETDDEWKRMPLASSSTVENSPLSGKASTAGELPSSITTHRKRRESILHQAETELSPSDSGSVIAALVADRRKAKAEAKEKELRGKESTAKSSENPNIYESKDPLPAPAEEVPAKEVPTKRKGEMRTSRVSRRHTSVPRDLAHGDDSEASDIEASKKGRRQPTLGSRSSTARTEAGKEGDGAKTLKKATSAAPITEPEATGSRRERIAERRRSMML